MLKLKKHWKDAQALPLQSVLDKLTAKFIEKPPNYSRVSARMYKRAFRKTLREGLKTGIPTCDVFTRALNVFKPAKAVVRQTYRQTTGDRASDSSIQPSLTIVIHDAFREADHPRGQPENRGEFASSSGGGGAAAKKPGMGHNSGKEKRLPGSGTRVSTGRKTFEPTAAKVTPPLKENMVKAATKEENRVNKKGEPFVARVHTQADGSPLPEHIQALKIPPAWTDVVFSNDPNSALQAAGKDAKGKVQSLYSLAHGEESAIAKFSRITDLAKDFSTISKKNEAARSDPKTQDVADCLSLVMKMGVRPGSDADTGAKEKAYGATTLLGQHVVTDGKEVRLKFVGKKGVKINLPVHDEELAKMLLERSKAAGIGGKLFPRASDKTLLNHAHEVGGYKVKDYRTYLGTSSAIKMVDSMPVPKTEAGRKKAILAVATHVSAKLGNSPAMALSAYINPTVFAKWSLPENG